MKGINGFGINLLKVGAIISELQIHGVVYQEMKITLE